MITLRRMSLALVAMTCCLAVRGEAEVTTPSDTLSSDAVADFMAKNPEAHVVAKGEGDIVVKLYKEVFYNIRESENNEKNATEAFREVEDFMKRFSGTHIHVVGYADRGTGNEKLNKMYAQRRASQVRDDLIHKYDIDPNLITAESMGDMVQPYKDNDRNRCIIISGFGYLSSKYSAKEKADVQRKEFQQEKELRYAEERERQRRLRKDTVYISRVDTLWMRPKADTLKPERPFGLNKQHRWRNWFITFAGGPAIFQGDHNSDAVYKDRIYPAFSLQLGKWIYPIVGLRAGVNLDLVHNYYNDYVSDLHSSERYAKRPWLSRMEYKAWNFHADLMINLSALMWRPYNKRIYNLIPYVGVGCIVNWDQPYFDYATSWNVGVLNSFRVCERLDINLDIRLKKFADHFNGYRQGRSMEGMTNLSIGATWHFTKRGF